MHYNPENSKSRWLGYFDLLGTSELIRSGKINQVFSAYRVALEHLHGWKKREASIAHAWFSDTFLLYSDDDSGESFASIEMVCRWLMFALLRRSIPVRGSLACGQFYADASNSLYLGESLLEAYEWGENQDWIGYILTPSAVSRLDQLSLHVEERLNYAKYDIPFKKKPGKDAYKFGACILGNWMSLGNGENVLIGKLVEMMNSQDNEKVRKKYERTITFIEKNQRKLIQK